MSDNLSYGSLCSGICSESVAWNPLGWNLRWLAEIDPFCCSLLREKHPATQNLGDIREVQYAETVNLIVGGTPCQSFSVNGKRKGMDDERGKLSRAFVRIVGDVRPRWFIWENVKGALSADNGRAFAELITAFSEFGYGWAWRCLDLRGFHVPQRRQRLFLVGHYGNYANAVASLFNQPTEAADRGSAEHTGQGALAGVDGWTGDTTPKRCKGYALTLRSGQGGEGAGVVSANTGIRKFSVLEHERLQGLPDDYTAIDHNGKPASDAMRRFAIGNSFPPPILQWIGKRIQFLDRRGLG